MTHPPLRGQVVGRQRADSPLPPLFIRAETVVQEARRWLGTPWVHQASVRGVGCDCIGLVGGVAAAVGCSDAWVTDVSAEFKGYGRQPKPNALLDACARFLLPAEGAMALADVLVMAIVERTPQHFALLSRLDPPYIIHAYLTAHAVVENRLDAKWQRRIVRRYRLPGVIH